MDKYYVTIRITYVDYDSMARSALKIRRAFAEPQKNICDALLLAVESFYYENENCDIVGVEVLENALF